MSLARPLPLFLLPWILLAGCQALPHRLPDAGASPRRQSSAETRQALERAQQQAGAARQASAIDPETEELLRQAEQAAGRGNNPRAQSLARQAEARASQALD
jgi:hypothetical protein